ncbi:hypothetical protein IGI04_012280 [Brassica rapa subsp. trilocularis]|uniref:Uncharacterized protein n=2 Tax=Brassica TaxID=3705 RepID=A0ABQ7N7L2_BRACM|nr:hypothetical protein IGI04_012280 [Brassica rapa subsp. trilocularis]KAH0934624.1 hypothetical protein HID58_011741 [Brassica napus]CAF2128686.1 unnamed protein product [Brassica napus]
MMTSSIVSCTFFFFLLLIVFPHMDRALGTQTELHKLSRETNYPDKVTVQSQRRYFIGPPSIPCQLYQRCKRTPPTPPTPTPSCHIYNRCKGSPGKYGSGH